jgi:nucleoside-diphosphate-sugar epimerase
MKKILVTGANGFIGEAICRELKNASYDIYKLVRKSEKKQVGQKNVLVGDIGSEDFNPNIKTIGSADILIHCAGLAHQFGNTVEEQFWQVNVEGTQRVAELALKLKVKHFIHISSVSVYGIISNEKSAINETTYCQPKDIYSRSKFESEKRVRSILRDTVVNLTILRPVTVIGEGDRGNVYRLIKLIRRGKFIWLGRGRNEKSLIYKNDLARAVLALIEQGAKKGEKFNIYNLSAHSASMFEIVGVISRLLKRKIIPLKIPVRPVLGIIALLRKITKTEKLIELENSINKWIRNDVYSAEKFFRDYGYRPETPIPFALEKEVKWFLNKKC